MAVVENSKLTVVGAGSVGASLAYAALIRGSASEVALYDIAAEKVEAEVLDLAHGTQFTDARVSGGDDLAVVEGSHVVVITAGAKQKRRARRGSSSPTRMCASSSSCSRRSWSARPTRCSVLVTNPVDVLTVVAQRITGCPPNRVFGSGTVLDTSRLRWLLARRAGVTTSSVHADIVGEHGDTEFPLWSNARIGPVPILDWRGGDPFTLAELDEIAHEVRNAAYTVIRGKGATNSAIGLAGARIVEAVLDDEHAVLPVSTVLGGLHGIDGVALSVPCLVGGDGAFPLEGVPFSPDEEALLRASADAIRASVETLGR